MVLASYTQPPRLTRSRFQRISFVSGLFLRAFPLCLAILSCCGGALPALHGAERPAAEYHVRLWGTDERLPHNSVGSVLQDQRGFIWFATGGGLARFDGREIREVEIPAAFRKVGFNVRDIAEEDANTLLIASTSGDVVRLRGTEFSVHPVTPELAGEPAVDLHVEPGGVLWVRTLRNTLFRWENGKAERVREREQSESTSRHMLARDIEGTTWVTRGDALCYYRNGRLIEAKDIPPSPKLIAPSRAGHIWVCTPDGLFRLEKGRLIQVETEIPWRTSFRHVRHIFEDSHGVLWVASSRRGLYRFANGQFTAPALPFSSASYVTEDAERNIWVATDGNGAAQLRAKTHRVFNTRAGLHEDACSTVAEDTSGAVWLANRAGGVAKIVDLALERTSATSESLRRYANVVCADQDGYLWFGGGNEGLSRAPLSALDRVEKMPVPQANLHVLLTARNGDVWAVGETLGFYRKGIYHDLPIDPALAQFPTFTAAEDRNGHLWFGTAGGMLLKYDGERLVRYDDRGQLPPQPIHALYVDEGNILWIATADGLAVKEGEKIRVITEAEGLVDDLVVQLVEDDRGYLWLGSRRGLFYALKADLLAVARGKQSRVLSHTFGKDQGLLGFAPIVNYQPSTCKGSDGTLWFATSGGALAVDALAQVVDAPPAPVYIDGLLINNQHVVINEQIQIPAGTSTVEFRFAVPSFTAPEAVMLRHQLQGVDEQWVQTSSARSALYSHLPPGKYTMSVTACNSHGVWNTQGDMLQITVLPAWWQTAWARLGALLLFTSAVAGSARYWAQRKLKLKIERLEREHALEKERTRIARDLHDDLGGGLIELGLLADRLAANSPSESRGALQVLAARTRRLGAELASIIWAVNAKNDSLDRLALFVRQYSQRLFRNSAIECIVSGAETIAPLPLSPDTQHHLLAIAKEAMNNILTHSHATYVAITMKLENGVFEISLKDNGVGFPVSSAESFDGNGLKNMRARAGEIGSSIRITSEPGQGTTIVVTYKATPAAIATEEPKARTLNVHPS